MVLVRVPEHLVHYPSQARNATNRLRLTQPVELWLREHHVPYSVVMAHVELRFQQLTRRGKRMGWFSTWHREFHVEFHDPQHALMFKLSWL